MKKWMWIAGLVLLLAGGGVAALLLVEREPRTATEALQRAEKRLTRFSTLPGLGPDETRKEQDDILGRFRKIGEKWGSSPEAPAGARRIADLLRQWKRIPEAVEAFKALKTADGLWIAAELVEQELGKPDDAMALLEEFIKTYGTDPRADAAAWKVIEFKIAAGKDRYAPMDLIQAGQEFIVQFPKSPMVPKAMLLIAETYASVKEFGAALREFDGIIEKFEGSPSAAKALLEKGKILAEQMGRKKEGKEALEELEKKHPDTPEAREGKGVREKAEQGAQEEEAEKKEDDFFKERYGKPGGDLAGAVSPRFTPVEFLRDLIEQQIDILHYDIEVTPKFDDKTLKATAAVRMKNNGDEKKAIRMMIHPGLTLSGVSGLKFDHKDGRILIQLGSPLANGAELQLQFEWTVKELGADTPLRLGVEGYAAPGALWYPITYFGDLHTATLKVNGVGSVLAIDSTKPVFGVFFSYGSQKPTTKGKVSYYTTDAGPRTAGVVDKVLDILSFYEKEFGPLPNSNLTLVDVDLPDQIGGISPCGIIFLNRTFMESVPDPVSLLAHELAHQWWGNLVPICPAKADYAAWLSEGLATHSEAQYLDHKFGPERARQHLEKGALIYMERVLHLPDDALSTCWPGHPEYPAVVYLKGAAVLGMLKAELGPAFSAGLRRYVTDCSHKESGIPEFRAALEKESGRDLKTWFAQWVERPGIPHLSIGVDGKDLAIKQEPLRARVGGKITEFFFTLKLEVEIDGAIRVLDVSKAEEKFTLAAEPRKIVLDPARRILKRPGPANEWTRK